MKFKLLLVICAWTLGCLTQAQAQPESTSPEMERVQKEIRHELVMLPNLGVFDNLAFRVDGYDVTLVGHVTRPTLKSDAERAVKRIEGVGQLSNEIEVLPLSTFDDALRIRLFWAIYGYAPLQKYALSVNKSIRIIVSNGHVELEGAVDDEADKNVAGIRANGVSDVFSVKNSLRVVK